MNEAFTKILYSVSDKTNYKLRRSLCKTKLQKIPLKGNPFYVGIDSYKKSLKMTILGEQYEHKTMSQNPYPGLLATYLYLNFPGGIYHAVYEAGFNGFESCYRLNQLVVSCIVIHAADVPTNQKEKLQKTDTEDSRNWQLHRINTPAQKYLRNALTGYLT